MKILFHLKGGQKNEPLLNLIFPDYPDGNGGEDGSGKDESGSNGEENTPINTSWRSLRSAKEKETDNAVSASLGCAYTTVMVEVRGIAPLYRRMTI